MVCSNILKLSKKFPLVKIHFKKSRGLSNYSTRNGSYILQWFRDCFCYELILQENGSFYEQSIIRTSTFSTKKKKLIRYKHINKIHPENQ